MTAIHITKPGSIFRIVMTPWVSATAMAHKKTVDDTVLLKIPYKQSFQAGVHTHVDQNAEICIKLLLVTKLKSILRFLFCFCGINSGFAAATGRRQISRLVFSGQLGAGKHP